MRRLLSGLIASALVLILLMALSPTSWAQSIIITDSGTSKIESTITLGNSDSITLLGVGSNCVELARANT